MSSWYREVEEIVGKDSLVTDQSILHSYVEVVNSDNIGGNVRENDFVVARPRSTDEVARIVRFAARKKIPLIARGAGTSREGATLPLPKSVVVDFTTMSRILDVNVENGTVLAQPGIALDLLEEKLNERGLSVGHGPEHATLGGSIGTNSLGQGSSRFGDMRNFVADLEVVVGEGMVFHTGRAVWRNNTGYSLTQLFIGSEGTLGLITAVTLKAGARPESTQKRMYAFQSPLDHVVSVARGIEGAFLPDGNRVDDEARNDGEVSTIRVTFRGKREVVELQTKLCDEFVSARGGQVVPDDIAADLVQKRSAKGFEMGVRPTEARNVPEEPALRFSDWKSSLEKWKNLCERHEIDYHGCQLNISYPGVITFYSGYSTNRPEKVESYRLLMREFYSYVIERQGSFSATHGVGKRMSGFMSAQYSKEYLELMRRIKGVFDPLNIFNPSAVL